METSLISFIKRKLKSGNINRDFSDFIRDMTSSFRYSCPKNCHAWWMDSDTFLVACGPVARKPFFFIAHFSLKLATLR